MRNGSTEPTHFTVLDNTMLLWGRGTDTPNCTWRCRMMQERRVGGKKKWLYHFLPKSFNASLVAPLPWLLCQVLQCTPGLL